MGIAVVFNQTDKKIQQKSGMLFVGTKGIKDPEDWRVLGFKLVNYCRSNDIKEIDITILEDCQEFLEGTILGQYEYNLKKKRDYKEVEINYNVDASILKRAKTTAYSQNIVRDLVNTPPNIANAEHISKEIQDRFVGTSVSVELYDVNDLEDFNMRGHIAVNAASNQYPMTLKLTYTPENQDQNTKHHIFVGKGLTYDSGGLSIKPTNSMVNMQADKAGAMTLIGLMEYLKTNGGNSKVTCYIALAENMINENSYRPGDILTMKNGKTVKINNTDAEGRLVLFDNICLAQEQNKSFTSITSIATLTGSAVVQFGNEAAGLVSFNNKLKRKIQKAGDKQGEIFLDAPFHKYMLDGVKDDVADLSNTGTPTMGCQKAGLFLTEAVKKKNKNKFIHIDIAGPAFVDKGFGSNPKGATGFAVRTLIELVK